MTLTLRARLLTAHAAVVAAALIAMGLFAAQEQRRWVEQQSRATLERAVLQIARQLPESANWDALADSLGVDLGYRVTLIDATGRVVGDSQVAGDELANVENHAGRPEVKAALHGMTGGASRRSRTVGQDLLYVAVPVPPLGSRPVAVARVAEPLVGIAMLDASLLRLSLLAGLAALLISVPLLLWVTGWQAGRVRAIARASERVGGGDFSVRAPERPDDELGRLGAGINRMARELEMRIESLGRERDQGSRVLERMVDGVALIDAHGHILRANTALATLLSVEPPVIGTSLSEFARLPELVTLVESARTSDGPVESAIRAWAPGPKLLRSTAIRLDRDADSAIVLIVHDLTEAERVNRMRQDFVANVSHELRTPLTSMLGYAETLLHGGLEDLEHREGFVRIIRDQTERLQALVDDLLSLAELEQPSARLKLGSFDLRDAAAHELETVRERAQRAGLTLELDAPQRIEVMADRTRIEQVLANLLDNALKYTERGGITVRVGGNRTRAWCEVRDSGVGIPEEDQPRIFERFYRVDKARSRELGGTGLGLSIVKHIVTLHGGELSVTSTPGRGSAFRFEIPRGVRAGWLS
jgi:two-component system phosphate regulon sensor histidine kinase PhoR